MGRDVIGILIEINQFGREFIGFLHGFKDLDHDLIGLLGVLKDLGRYSLDSLVCSRISVMILFDDLMF